MIPRKRITHPRLGDFLRKWSEPISLFTLLLDLVKESLPAPTVFPLFKKVLLRAWEKI